jgi:hypothetical protein
MKTIREIKRLKNTKRLFIENQNFTTLCRRAGGSEHKMADKLIIYE